MWSYKGRINYTSFIIRPAAQVLFISQSSTFEVILRHFSFFDFFYHHKASFDVFRRHLKNKKVILHRNIYIFLKKRIIRNFIDIG